MKPNPEDFIALKSKKDIEAIAALHVVGEVEAGYTDVLKELVKATRLATYYASVGAELRKYAINALEGEKNRKELEATISLASSPSTWEIEDEYLDELKKEMEVVKDKAKLLNEKDRHHITLAGEQIIIHRGFKKAGGEIVKVIL